MLTPGKKSLWMSSMLKRYKNAFFEAIQAAGLDVGDFAGEEVSDPVRGPRFVIQYKPANLSFTAGNNPNNPKLFEYAYTIYGAGFDQSLEPTYFPGERFDSATHERSTVYTNFETVQRAFKIWFSSQVRLAIDEELLPDLWAAAPEDLTAIESRPISSVTDFTDEERQ
jgi:hypothetical protein